MCFNEFDLESLPSLMQRLAATATEGENKLHFKTSMILLIAGTIASMCVHSSHNTKVVDIFLLSSHLQRTSCTSRCQ